MEKALHEIPEDRVHDPREESEFFQGLPEHAKEEMRERWRREEGHDLDRVDRRHYTYKVYIFEMVACFLFFHLFDLFRHPAVAIWAIGMGALTGAVAAFVRAKNLTYPPIALLGFILTGSFNLFAWVGIAGIAAVMGNMHRVRSFEGSEV